MADKNNHRIPKLRFPEFTREWEEKKLEEIYEKHNEKNDLSFGVDKVISVANMYYKQDANVGNDDYLRTYNIFRLGDIAYEGNKSSNFTYGRFVENTIGDGIVSHVFDVYRPIIADYCIDYWKYAINYETIMRPVLEKATIKSTMMNNLIAKDFLKQSILIPPTLAEQQKIADCLLALDDMISAEGKKTEALREYKRGLMQQLFPTNGATTPKLRFPGFTGEWEFVNGNKLFASITNKVHNSDLPILALTQEQGAIPRDLINYNVIVSEKSVAGYKVVENDDFIISLRSFQGGIEYSRYKGLCSPAYIVLRKKDKHLVSDFYRVYFKSYNYIQALNKNLEGIRDGKMISYQQFSEIKLPLPSPAEQQKIADCISALDEIINAQAQKTEALREYKRGLMQQLFPQTTTK
ncbi:MAG: restriction endonuclease subunit S [Paludibacteraceae bacterium]|nr:restriction endonuclease subunit S [Paludibacteraceae bacterium]